MWCGMGEGGVRVRVWAVADREGLRRVFGGASARVRVFNFNLLIGLSAARQMRGYDVAKGKEMRVTMWQCRGLARILQKYKCGCGGLTRLCREMRKK